MISRRTVARSLAAVLLAPWAARSQAEEAFPNRPLRIVVGFSAGGGVDIIARSFAERLQSQLGQAVVIENRPGSNGNLAANHVAAGAAPDGYTLLMINSAMATNNPFLYARGVPDYQRDLVPVVGITGGPFCVIVPSSLGVTTLQEFAQYARSRPGELNGSSGGNGNLGHLALELFKRDQRLDIIHVPFKGTGPAIQEMMAGRIHVMIDAFNQVKGQVESNLFRVLAVAGPERLAALPAIPTTAEAGFPKLIALGWTALEAPAQTPLTALATLRSAAAKVMATKDYQDYLTRQGSPPRPFTPAQVSEAIRAESAVWGEVIRSNGIKLD